MKNVSAVSAPTIADLWRDLRAWLADALRRGPAAVMKLVTRKAQDAVARRLRLIESLLLKLLLIEAVSLHPRPMNTGRADNAEVMGPGLGAARQSGNEWEEDPANPETWRVRFRPRMRQLGYRASEKAQRVPPPRATTTSCASRARKLARRLEALRRVIAHPRRAIAALARRLRALGPSAGAVARAIALSRPRHTDASLTLGHAMVRALDAAFLDSS